MRVLLDDGGAPLRTVQYDPWGVPERGTPAPFGFTEELHAGGLVYLRARWYDGSAGTFTQRDPFGGFPEQPYSLHPYQYGYANPGRWTDASGRCIGPDGKPCPVGPEPTPPLPGTTVTPVAPSPVPETPQPLVPAPETGPVAEKRKCAIPDRFDTSDSGVSLSLTSYEPFDVGYIEGGSANAQAAAGITGGIEEVYDLYDLEYGVFTYFGGGLYTGIGFDVTGYVGIVFGWSLFPRDPGIHNYSGPFVTSSVSVNLPFKFVAATLQGFVGPAIKQANGEQKNMWGVVAGGSIGVNANPNLINGGGGAATYTLQHKQVFRTQNKKDKKAAIQFIAFILTQPSPTISLSPAPGRSYAIAVLLANGAAWERANTE